MTDVRVHRNVVLRADWGLEVASAGLYDHNLVFETGREGLQVSDAFQAFGDLRFEDNVVVNAGHDGVHISAVNGPASGLSLVRTTVVGAARAGVLLASGAGMTLDIEDLVVVDSDVALDGWGEDAVVELTGCRTTGNGVDIDRLLEGRGFVCETAPNVPTRAPAGPDQRFFTADDPWLVEGGATLP